MKAYSILLIIVLGLTPYIFSQVPFTTHIITNNMGEAHSVYAADIDDDGDMDVLSASDMSLDEKIAWYENDGNQNFTIHIITTM